MMQNLKKLHCHLMNRKTAMLFSVFIFVIAVASSAFRKDVPVAEVTINTINADSIESVKAFETVYKTLMSPRCMNCHPAGDVPLQGDDSHLHAMGPKRGVDGKGVYAMKCSNCHQETNTPGLNTPPGNPDWHLPPASMRMVFQGKSPHELAKQLVDRKQNGNKDMKKLIEHADDGLVLAGWNPGDGRTLPPVSHAEFKQAWITWIKKGAYALGK
jgi:cytochrome c5